MDRYRRKYGWTFHLQKLICYYTRWLSSSTNLPTIRPLFIRNDGEKKIQKSWKAYVTVFAVTCQRTYDYELPDWRRQTMWAEQVACRHCFMFRHIHMMYPPTTCQISARCTRECDYAFSHFTFFKYKKENVRKLKKKKKMTTTKNEKSIDLFSVFPIYFPSAFPWALVLFDGADNNKNNNKAAEEKKRKKIMLKTSIRWTNMKSRKKSHLSVCQGKKTVFY